MTHLSLVVVHFNQRATTLRCLDSLMKVRAKGVRLKIIVVDNGSLKPLSLPTRLRQKRNIILLRSDANLGFTGGNNLGLHYAIEHYHSQYLCLLNNDTTVRADFLEKMLALARSDNKIGLLSPKIYFSAGKEYHKKSYSASERGHILWFAGGSIDWRHLTAFHLGVDELDRGQFDHLRDCDFATGCCLLIKREVLERVGLLDKRYFLYFEDVDLSLRARQAGYRVVFCPQAVIWHDNAGSSSAGSALQLYYQERNRSLLAWLHGDWHSRYLAFRLQLMNLLSHDSTRQKAVFDFYRHKFGKQALV